MFMDTDQSSASWGTEVSEWKVYLLGQVGKIQHMPQTLNTGFQKGYEDNKETFIPCFNIPF